MALDTRGFVDGALQGFQVAEGYYQRKKDNDRRDKLDEREEQRYQQQQTRLSQLDAKADKRYQEEVAYRNAQTEKEERRYQDRLKTEAAERAQRGKLLDVQTKTADFELGQKKKLAYLQENMPVIQSNLKSFMETGQLDPMFDHEYIKGSAYDPRRYTPRVMQAAFDIEATMPKVLDGTISYRDPAFTKSLGVLLERNVKQGIGDVDPESGKKIANKEYLRHDFVADIDPNREGDQPGVVIGLKVTYEDGTSQVAPVTEGRKPGASEAVKVIPLDALMKDVTGQLSMAKQFFTSEHYANLFAAKGGKNSDEIGKQWREAVTDLEKDRTKAINELMDPTPEQIEALNVRFNERRTVIDQIYGKLGGKSGGVGGHKNAASQWAGNDPQKQQFIAELGQTMDVAKIPVEALEHNYQRVLKVKQDKQSEEQKKALLAKIKSENSKDEPSNYDRQAQEYAERSPEWMNSLSDVVSGAFKTPEAKSIKESDYTDYNSVVRPF
ncbi:ATPase [Vibrio navarrensis]|uniref:ATPase n=1 Tax=Vibrio navarrensis TaxID=29495 RepID=UPI001EE9DDB1|nr:ATPase [Vibrio navarrensis]